MRENGLDYALPHDGIETLPTDQRRDAFIPSDINTLLGIGKGPPYFDLEVLAPEIGFHENDLHRSHMLSVSAAISPLVEITEGEHAGRIIYTDRELFHGLTHDDLDGKSADVAV
jgi:hypothetical protein